MGKMSPEESSRRARIARSPKGPFSVHLEANPRMGDGSQAKTCILPKHPHYFFFDEIGHGIRSGALRNAG